MKKVIDFFLLFSSTSTLICCALPALLISMGAGSTMAFISGHVPGFIWLSQNKVYLFIFAGIMLAAGGVLLGLGIMGAPSMAAKRYPASIEVLE